MQAPVANAKSNLDIRTDEMKSICKNILEKHLDGRKFIKDKVQKWGEFILNDTEEALKKKYPEYGYGIFFYISEKTSYNSKSKAIDYIQTDIQLVQAYHTNDFFSEMRIFANKKYSKRNDFLNNITPNEIININKKIQDNLEGRTYIFEKGSNYIENIVEDINNILLKRKNRPCSHHIGFINALPIKGLYFTYKFINLEYMPLFFTYSNDYLSCNIYLFIVNN